MAVTESVFDQLTLTPPISAALLKLKINRATDVQEAVIPEVLARRDLLVSAHTGSGKTVAFVLPLVHELQHRPAPDTGTRALILAPTRELARQTQHVCEILGQAVNVTSVTLTGGVAFQEQHAALRKAPDIVIATPGRLIEHINRGTLDLSDLSTIVLDEADRMLDMGFRDDVLKILECCPAERQTLLFSATLDHRGVLALGKTLQNDALTIALNEARSVPDNIKQSYLMADDVAFKEKLVKALIANHSDQQIIIFTNTIVRTQSLHSKLNDPALRCALLHGDLTQ
ncbi:MAG: DEAD/DEAH box helicase, partial [Natronospirillum sp.]